MTVTVVRPNPMFGATPGRTAEVVRSYWRNGEGWHRLRDTTTGETFDSPDVFWSEVGQ